MMECSVRGWVSDQLKPSLSEVERLPNGSLYTTMVSLLATTSLLQPFVISTASRAAHGWFFDYRSQGAL